MSTPSASRQHADWLSLVEVSGPFVSLPVLMRAFPQGLDARDPAQAKALREAFEDWQNNAAAAGKQRAWLMHVLTALLGYPSNQVVEGQALPAGLEARMPEMGETLRPDVALVGPAGNDSAGQAQLLIATYPADQMLDKPVTGRHWKATPATRMMELLHGAGVPLGLVTNGEQWMLVYAPRGEVTGYASWYASLWLDEPITLRAFHSLLGVRRFFGVAADGTLQALLKESASDQQEVTDQLGYQVREAVEVLVQSFDALDKESNRTLLKGVSPAAQYDAALTVMMRLVFLFSAEERGLLHLGKPLYDDNYAVSTLQEQLQEVADQHGEEVLERRSDAWARLLASFRAVHGGIRHQDLLMQAYGGSLFDPDRYAFLEGRAAGSQWRSTGADPLAVNNRVVLHLLNSLQRLRIKGGAGGATETRRLSFRALGVEQIGHVYEGLLDHTAVRATEPVLGLKGTRSKEPEIALTKLESLLAQGQDKLIDFLKEETGRSAPAIRRTLDEGGLLYEHRLLVACNNDEGLQTRLRPFAGLIRSDSFEQPLVVLVGSVFVTAGSTRRSTGAHYTPPSLTEPIVQHTLEPLVYVGPAEGLQRDEWKLKTPKEILSLKVCDMAMGSGAFLVQVCRYLAERLTEAWEYEESRHPGEVLVTPDGDFSIGKPSERLVPSEANERIAIARRVVADRCLYGVDINPMAVEMAKLSLWLITIDAYRPFTFLDHALKCGDSLLGVTSLMQLENFSLREDGGKLQGFNAPHFSQSIVEATSKRTALEAMPSNTPEQIARKAALYGEAEQAVVKLSAAADVLVALELEGAKGKAYEIQREAAADFVISHWETERLAMNEFARLRLGERSCLHFALAFPEVLGVGGFDAVIGNPPYMGGTKVSNTLGQDYLYFLIGCLEGSSGNVDLATFFVGRAASISRRNYSCLGLITTSSILAGDSYRAGIGRLLKNGYVAREELSARQWPGQSANVAYVPLILLTARGGAHSEVEPYLLRSNDKLCNRGADVFGEGFILTNEEYAEWKSRASSSLPVVMPYLGGAEFNNHPELLPSRFIINFGEMNEPEAQVYADAYHRVAERVKPARAHVKQRDRRELWWLYATRYPLVNQYFSTHNRCIAIAQMSKHLAFSVTDSGNVFSNSLLLFLFDSFSHFAVLQSSVHAIWVYRWAGAMRTDTRYTSTDCFETFPFPSELESLEVCGDTYHEFRRRLMIARNEGLTKIYNRFHESTESSHDVIEFRRLHAQIDRDVASAYGWRDLDLNHGFHQTKQGIRYTISEEARREVLSRLLTLNHQRHAEEESERAASPISENKRRTRKKKADSAQVAMDL